MLLGALEGKVVIGSMNRGGLDGATWTMDDRFTGYDAASIAANRLEGGKMLLRIDDTDQERSREEFVEALRWLMSNPRVRDTLGQNGRTYIAQHFRWDAVMSRFERLVSRVKSR